MRAVITVVGRDMVGILAKVSGECAARGVNITEVSQTVLQDMFCMIMLADCSGCDTPFTEFADRLGALGPELGLSIHVMHEDIFDSMHRV